VKLCWELGKVRTDCATLELSDGPVNPKLGVTDAATAILGHGPGLHKQGSMLLVLCNSLTRCRIGE
jgi:hypothetical protein